MIKGKRTFYHYKKKWQQKASLDVKGSYHEAPLFLRVCTTNSRLWYSKIGFLNNKNKGVFVVLWIRIMIHGYATQLNWCHLFWKRFMTLWYFAFAQMVREEHYIDTSTIQVASIVAFNEI